jgi:hypothetical protein
MAEMGAVYAAPILGGQLGEDGAIGVLLLGTA